MAESVLEVVGKLQSRLAGSSEPKKVTVGGGAAEAPPSPAGVVRRSRGSGGPGLPREGGGGGTGSGAGPGLPSAPPTATPSPKFPARPGPRSVGRGGPPAASEPRQRARPGGGELSPVGAPPSLRCCQPGLGSQAPGCPTGDPLRRVGVLAWGPPG